MNGEGVRHLLRFLLAVAFPGIAGCADRGVSVHGTIPDEPACPGCSIDLHSIAVLGSERDDASARVDAAARGCMIAPLSAESERWLSGARVGGGSLSEYKGFGASTRVWGRPGRGPGELGQDLRLAAPVNDSVLVLDDQQLRASWFTTGGRFLSSFPMPERHKSFAVLADQSVVFYRPPREGEIGGSQPFLHFGPDGVETRRFGAVVEGVPWDFQFGLVAPARDGGVWTASNVWEYNLKLVGRDDSTRVTLDRAASWFPDVSPQELGNRLRALYTEYAPQPMLMHAFEDPNGYVWTYSLVADERWKRGPFGMDARWLRENLDTMIEVIDIDARRVRARLRHDELLGGMCGSRYVYAVRETSYGDSRLVIYEPRLMNR